MKKVKTAVVEMEVDDAIYAEACRIAAWRGTTPDEVIEAAVRLYLNLHKDVG